MVSESTVAPPVDKTLRDVNQLIAEDRFAEANRLCFKAIKWHGGHNAFYRAKCYCDMRLSRWHSCLETVGWLHLFVEHPSLVVSGHKRCPKRLRREASAKYAEQHSEQVDAIRTASRTHIENGECLWLHFEQAYCYYKLGQFDRALKALRMCAEDERPRDLHRGLASAPPTNAPGTSATSGIEVKLDQTLAPKYRFLLAQTYVRLGHFEAARAIYDSLQNGRDDTLVALNSLSVDLNLAANLDHTAQKNLFLDIDREMEAKLIHKDSIGYEFFYNWAIAKLLDGDFTKAEEYLDLSEERLSSELKDELGDIHALHEQPELAAMGAMRVYLLSNRGCDDLAETRITGLMETFRDVDGVDPGVMLILLNNWLSLCSADEEISGAIAKLELLLKKSNVVCKFTPHELVDVHHNIVRRLLASCNQRDAKAHMLKFMGRLRHDESLYNNLACVDYLEGKIDGSISILKRGLSVKPHSIPLMRSIVRVLLSERRYKSVLSTVQPFAADLLNGGHAGFYWGTILQCYIHLGNKHGVIDVLSKLVDCGHTPEIAEALQCGCRFLESQGMHQEARGIYSRLCSLDPNNTIAYCGVLYNESFVDDESIGAFTLPSSVADSLFKELRFIDAEELENEGKLKMHRQVLGESKTRKSRKRRRAPKVDTSKGQPDPERWLPKFERAAFKKMLKRKKDMTKGYTQGSTDAAGPSKPTSLTISTDSSQSRRRRNRKK